MHVKIIQKNVFVENVWPANLALFYIYVSTHCVEKVKWLDYNLYSQLTRWCIGNTSALGGRGPGFNPQLRQRFLSLVFLFCCCCFYFFVKNTLYDTLFVTKVCNSFYNFNLFSILKILQDL